MTRRLRSARQAEARRASLGRTALQRRGLLPSRGPASTSHEFDVVADSLLRNGALRATAFVAAGAGSRSAPASNALTASRSSNAVTGGSLRSGRNRPEYFPVTFVVSKQAGARAARLRPRLRPRARGPSCGGPRDSGKPQATPVMPLLLGGTRPQHLPAGLSRRRSDRAPSPSVAPRCSASPSAPSGSRTWPRRRSPRSRPTTCSSDSGRHGRRRRRRALGETRPGADPHRRPHLAARHPRPSRPGLGLPVLIAVVGISLAALLGALVLSGAATSACRSCSCQASQDRSPG